MRSSRGPHSAARLCIPFENLPVLAGWICIQESLQVQFSEFSISAGGAFARSAPWIVQHCPFGQLLDDISSYGVSKLVVVDVCFNCLLTSAPSRVAALMADC